MLLFTAVASLILAIILGSLLSTVRRGLKSQSWTRTMGRVKRFGYSYGVPGIVYEYEVDGAKRTGQAIVPGFSSGRPGGTRLPKGIYLHPDGRLKFPPNAEVEVYYDPRKPADAALVPGIQRGIWKGFVLVSFLVAALGGFRFYSGWISSHEASLFPAFFAVAGLGIFSYGVRCLLRDRRTRKFPSVAGRLLRAKVVYSGSGGNSGSGYTPWVEFEYELDGGIYRSQQLTALQAQVLRSNKEKAQAVIDRLRAMPELPVYYDPQMPWDSFLIPGPLWGVFLPMLLGAVFLGFGLIFFIHQLK